MSPCAGWHAQSRPSRWPRTPRCPRHRPAPTTPARACPSPGARPRRSPPRCAPRPGRVVMEMSMWIRYAAARRVHLLEPDRGRDRGGPPGPRHPPPGSPSTRARTAAPQGRQSASIGDLDVCTAVGSAGRPVHALPRRFAGPTRCRPRSVRRGRTSTTAPSARVSQIDCG